LSDAEAAYMKSDGAIPNMSQGGMVQCEGLACVESKIDGNGSAEWGKPPPIAVAEPAGFQPLKFSEKQGIAGAEGAHDTVVGAPAEALRSAGNVLNGAGYWFDARPGAALNDAADWLDRNLEYGRPADGVSALAYDEAEKGVETLGTMASLAMPEIRLAKSGLAARGGLSLNSSSLAMGVERALPELLSSMGRHGRTLQIATEGSEELRYLNHIGAEANVGGETMTHILLRSNPSKAAVLEEFLHGTQFRLGIVQRLGVPGAETHVKSFMIRHSGMLGLGEADVVALRQLMEAGL
jgi:hypothetical protein